MEDLREYCAKQWPSTCALIDIRLVDEVLYMAIPGANRCIKPVRAGNDYRQGRILLTQLDEAQILNYLEENVDKWRRSKSPVMPVLPPENYIEHMFIDCGDYFHCEEVNVRAKMVDSLPGYPLISQHFTIVELQYGGKRTSYEVYFGELCVLKIAGHKNRHLADRLESYFARIKTTRILPLPISDAICEYL